jgi:hypothetical protein
METFKILSLATVSLKLFHILSEQKWSKIRRSSATEASQGTENNFYALTD